MSRFACFALALLLPLAAGCAGADAPADARAASVGVVPGTDSVVGEVTQAGAFTLYICGGSADFATRTHWFSGTLDADGAMSVDAGDGWTASGAWTAGGADGAIVPPDGIALAWSASSVDDGAAPGLYAGEDAGCRTGVVVLGGGGGDPRVQGTWCSDGGEYAQVTPIRSVEPQGFRVAAVTQIGPRSLLALPLDP